MPSQQKPSLEDLLKLKRAERTSQVDWNAFDADLKRAMFKTCVENSRVEKASWVRRVAFAFVFSIALFVVFLPDGKIVSTAEDSLEMFAERKTTPLPQLPTSFANGVMSSTSYAETPLSAQMSSSVGDLPEYVSCNFSGLASF